VTTPEKPPLLVTIWLDEPTEKRIRTFMDTYDMPSMDAAIYVLMQMGIREARSINK